MNDLIAKIKKKFMEMRHKELWIAGIILLAILMFYLSDCTYFTATEKQSIQKEELSYSEKMTRDILDAVKFMTGSGDCKVIINWADGGENVIAYTTSSSGSGETKTPEIVTINGVSSPIVLQEKYPQAQSIAIICPKNTSVKIKLDIKTMVSTLLNTSFDNIAIYSC